MLEAFQSLREELTIKKPTEVEPSSHASKAGPSSNIAAHLDLPPPRSSTNSQSEAMDVDVGPALPPRLVLNQTTSDQYLPLLRLYRRISRTLIKNKATGKQ